MMSDAPPLSGLEAVRDWLRARGQTVLAPIARVLGRLGLPPNIVSVAGMLLQIGIGVLFGSGRIVAGGWLLGVVSPLDALDGTLARLTGKACGFGAFLDSTLDRISDAALILGVAVYHLRDAAYLELSLALVALVASLMVSYTRARAEGLGFSCQVGWLTRPERVGLIALFCAVGLPGLLVWPLSTLSLITVVQRIAHVAREAR